MKRVYLDYAAATPVDPRVLKVMAPYFTRSYGNPGAIHREGIIAREAVAEARRVMANELGVLPREIVFTGSATESANLALLGAVMAWQVEHPKGTPHIIVSAIEHEAVLAPARALEKKGVRVTWLPVNTEGVVDLNMLRETLNENTVIVSVMYANNEIGTIQPVSEITRIIRKWKKTYRGVERDRKIIGDARYPIVHTDATQAANYLDMHIPRLGVDLLTMNAAKLYGPKGIGLLVVRGALPLSPVLLGGTQEYGLRAGSENTPAIIGFAEALRRSRAIAMKEARRLRVLRDRGISELVRNIPGIIINGACGTARLPNNVHFTIPGIDHEYLALILDARGFAVATKSACNESALEFSHVLTALRGTSNPQLLQGIRLSFGRGTVRDDIQRFVRTLRDVLPLATIPS